MRYLVTFRAKEEPTDVCLDCPYHSYVTDLIGDDDGHYCNLCNKDIPKDHDIESPWDGCPVTSVIEEDKT